MTHLSDEDLGDPERAETHRHLAACEQCRSAVADQRLVRERLRALPDPGAMPGPVSRAIDVALREAGRREHMSGRTIVPSPMPAVGSPRTWRSRPVVARALVAAAAATIVVGGAGALLSRQPHLAGGSTTSAQAGESSHPAPGAAQPSAPAGQVVASGTAYTRADVVRQATDLARPACASALSAHPGAPKGLLASAAGLDGCLRALGATSRPLVVDLASYDGRPAAVLVLPVSGGGEAVWVVARDCRPGADGTMFYSRLP